MTENEDLERQIRDAVKRRTMALEAELGEAKRRLKASEDWSTWKSLPAKWRRLIPLLVAAGFALGAIVGCANG